MIKTIKHFKDREELSLNAAEYISEYAYKCVLGKGFFSLVLSGGSTPRRLYEQLAGAPFRDTLPWGKIHVFWGDERCVPPDHSDSNYSMAEMALLSKVPIPANNIHRMTGENKQSSVSADDYEREIEDFFRNMKSTVNDFPSFDLILSGVGFDGHTASLFPGDDVLDERTRWVRAVEAPSEMPVRHRITLTVPIINHASRMLFLVSGERKKDIVRAIINDPDASEHFPAAMINAKDETMWFVDFEV